MVIKKKKMTGRAHGGEKSVFINLFFFFFAEQCITEAACIHLHDRCVL